MTDHSSFPAVLARVRAKVMLTQGKHDGKLLLMILDLIELLALDTLPAENVADLLARIPGEKM